MTSPRFLSIDPKKRKPFAVGGRAAYPRSRTDAWPTPADLYEQLDSEFHFDLDPCPVDPESDGTAPLLVSWHGRRVFCNCPYGAAIARWVARGPEADIAVFLVPARTDTRWFHDLVLPRAKEVRFLRGRLRFGDGKGPAPFPSMVVVFENESCKGEKTVL